MLNLYFSSINAISTLLPKKKKECNINTDMLSIYKYSGIIACKVLPQYGPVSGHRGMKCFHRRIGWTWFQPCVVLLRGGGTAIEYQGSYMVLRNRASSLKMKLSNCSLLRFFFSFFFNDKQACYFSTILWRKQIATLCKLYSFFTYLFILFFSFCSGKYSPQTQTQVRPSFFLSEKYSPHHPRWGLLFSYPINIQPPIPPRPATPTKPQPPKWEIISTAAREIDSLLLLFHGGLLLDSGEGGAILSRIETHFTTVFVTPLESQKIQVFSFHFPPKIKAHKHSQQFYWILSSVYLSILSVAQVTRL